MSHGHEFESPVDLHGRPVPAGHPLRWASVTIAVASLFLLVTNAVSISAWIEEQTPGPIQAKVAAVAGSWLASTEALGTATPRAALHKQWKAAQAVRFESEAKAPDQR